MPTYSEDGDGIMGESAYEILTDSTLLTDDEDDASSVASLDEQSEEEDSTSAEDAESLADFPQKAEHHDPHPGIPAFGGLDEQPLESSGMTMKSDGSNLEQITFEEPEEYAGDQISVSHSICDFNEAQTSEINLHIRVEEPPPTKLFATVRQTMSKSQLIMNEPFRVLYVGSTVAKDDIITKLGGALAVPITESTSSLSSWESSKGSRFNVIPVSSFGTRSSSPEVELVESFGVEMAVDVCTTAKSSRREGRPDTLCLWLNGNQSVQSSYGENGPEIETPGWKLPHLAVVFCSDDDNTQRRMNRVYARSFMARHSVPTLVISQNTLYHKPTENYTLDTRSVHMCLESQSESKYGNLVHKRLPVDLSTFLNLDVRQLNRNLACITGISSSQEIPPAPVGRARTSSSTVLNPLMRDVEKTPHRQNTNPTGSLYWIREQKRDSLWKMFLVGWLFVCGLAGATFAIAYMKFSKSSVVVEEATETVMKAVTVITATATSSMIITTTATSSMSVSTSTSVYNSMTPSSIMSAACGPKMDISGLIYDSSLLSLNESDQFSIHVIGENHILVRPPQKYLLLKNPPTLFVEVTRSDEKIDAELSKLFDGVYTLKLDSEEVWGLVNVSLWTKKKPLMKETLEVDFGSPWLKLLRWKKVAEQKRSELKAFIGQAKTDANRIASDLTQTAGKQATEVKGLMMARARELTEGVSRFYRETKGIDVKQFLPSAAPSVYVQTAQRQARSVWENKIAEMSEKKQKVMRQGWLRT